MYPLATGNYTAAQVTTQLLSGTGARSCRFDVLDRNLNVVRPLANVYGATVTMDATRDIKSTLQLNMLPDTQLAPFNSYIRAYYRIRMPDQGIAEWPIGTYVWTKPKRHVSGLRGRDEWNIEIPDLHQLLLFSGPGPGGYTLAQGSTTTTAIKNVLTTVLPSADTSGITPSASTTGGPLTWDITADYDAQVASQLATRAAQDQLRLKLAQATSDLQYFQVLMWNATAAGNDAAAHDAGIHADWSKELIRQIGDPNKYSVTVAPASHQGTSGNTWWNVIKELAASIGYYEPFFDAKGRLMTGAMPNLVAQAPVATFTSGASSILTFPIDTDEAHDQIANRVTVRGKTPQGMFAYAVADADTFAPNHPLAHNKIGYYIDAVVDDSVAGSQNDLQNRANAQLQRRLFAYDTVMFTTVCWPVMQLYDVVGIQVAGDYDFSTLQNVYVTGYAFDLFHGHMTTTAQRISPSGTVTYQ